MAATVWKGFITFGLVSFPVRLSAAARADRVQFHMLHRKDLSRVKEVWFCAAEDKPLDRAEIVKGYEAERGEYVVVDDEELKKVAPPTATTMDILQFVESSEVDPIYFETSYYIAPEEANAKPYGLFAHALQETKRDAIAKLAMHNREHIVLIRPAENGLLLHTLFYPSELNKQNRAGSAAAKYSIKELQLARTLVEQLTAEFHPEQFTDTYRANVEELIAKKKKGQKIPATKQPRHAPVIDLMEALKNSLKSVPAKGAAKPRKTPSSRKVA